jgi:chromosome segregation ATPase
LTAATASTQASALRELDQKSQVAQRAADAALQEREAAEERARIADAHSRELATASEEAREQAAHLANELTSAQAQVADAERERAGAIEQVKTVTEEHRVALVRIEALEAHIVETETGRSTAEARVLELEVEMARALGARDEFGERAAQREQERDEARQAAERAVELEADLRRDREAMTQAQARAAEAVAERERLVARAAQAEADRERLVARVEEAETQLREAERVRTELEDRAATAALAAARSESVRDEGVDRRQLDELEHKLAQTLAARSAAEARADAAAAELDRLHAELSESGAGRPAIEAVPQAPDEDEIEVTLLAAERDRAVADAARLADARDEALEQIEAEAITREELEAQLAKAGEAAPGHAAGEGAAASAGRLSRRMRSEYVVGWTLLLIALAAAIAVVTGAVRIELIP